MMLKSTNQKPSQKAFFASKLKSPPNTSQSLLNLTKKRQDFERMLVEQGEANRIAMQKQMLKASLKDLSYEYH